MSFRPQNYDLCRAVHGLESTQGGAIHCQIKHLGVLSTTYSRDGTGTPETMTVRGQEAPGTMSFGPRNYDL